MLPGGHELRPLLIEQQKTVQPDEQLASGPHTDAYAVPGRSRNRHGFNASADPTNAERNRKPRRLVLLASPLLTVVTTFSAMLMRLPPCSSLTRSSVEHLVHLREQPVQVEAAGDHDVEAERPPVRREEELATDLAGQRSLQSS